MRTNLIQSYMNNNPVSSKNDRNLNIEYVLSNRTFIKPLPGKGHIVNNNIFEAPGVIAKDFAYDMRAMHRASKGKANDHELGKINDIGMKLGGLAIAAYLMTRKQTPLKKSMELVGLASFFGAMALWPKIALQLPAKLIHGFNIRKEYEDSYGRKKMFFQDPQYIPWDLANDKKINSIGDRMGVPKDIANRREFIQEKMKKTAVQNNTLWMLTAGFATPIISALICNQCEKPLNNYLKERTLRKANSLHDNISEVYKNYLNKSAEELPALLDANKGKQLTPELSQQIKTHIASGMDPITSNAIKNDLDKLMGLRNKKFVINDNVLENIVKTINETVGSVVRVENLPDKNTWSQKLAGNLSKEISDVEMTPVVQTVCRELKKSLKENKVSSDDIDTIMDALLNSKKSIGSALRSNPSITLTDELVSNLKEISNGLSKFKAKNMVLDEYVHLKVAAAPETVVANAWSDVTNTMPKLFGFTDKEITAARHDRKLAGRILRDKLELIASKPDEYKKVFTELAEKISQLEKKVNILDASKNVETSYEGTVENIFKEASELLKKFNMNEANGLLVGKNGHVEGSLKNIQLSYVKDRLLGVRSSFYRMLNTMDFFKRIATLENIPALHDKMPLEVKEEIIELAKKLSIEGATSDFMTKFFEVRNPHPDRNALGKNITVKDGKVINEYLGKAVRGGKVELPNDKAFFQEIMKLLFENNMHSDTYKMLNDLQMDQGFAQYRREFIDSIGGHYYFAKQYHQLDGRSGAGTMFTKFLRMGMAPDQMLHGTVKEIFNTRKWLKMFGGFGAGLLGITVLSQFFFGKMKNPERIKHD